MAHHPLLASPHLDMKEKFRMFATDLNLYSKSNPGISLVAVREQIADQAEKRKGLYDKVFSSYRHKQQIAYRNEMTKL